MFSPFRGLLFDPTRVPSVGAATCPPYDVISPAQRRAYKAASPYNLVRLLLAEPGDERYQEAAATFQKWRVDGILPRDPSPRFYVYEMTYTDASGASRTALGVLGALDVVAFGNQVLPHEETMEHAKADRMEVLAATRANLDVIVALSPAPGLAGLLEPREPARLDFEADDVRHRLFDVTDPTLAAALSAAVASHPVSIADGHHRYTTALNYADRQRQTEGRGAWDRILCFMAPVEGGLTIGPIHRIFERATIDHAALGTAFEVLTTRASEPARAGDVVLVGGSAHPGPPLLLSPRPQAVAPLPGPWREASAAVAREILYPLLRLDEAGAEYVNSVGDGLRRLRDLPDGLLVVNAAVSRAAIAEASESGLRFPQKTTFFVPKPRAGLVVRAFD